MMAASSSSASHLNLDVVDNPQDGITDLVVRIIEIRST